MPGSGSRLEIRLQRARVLAGLYCRQMECLGTGGYSVTLNRDAPFAWSLRVAKSWWGDALRLLDVPGETWGEPALVSQAGDGIRNFGVLKLAGSNTSFTRLSLALRAAGVLLWKIAETANGNVEAKVVCFYRRRDIPSNLIALADKHAMLLYKNKLAGKYCSQASLKMKMKKAQRILSIRFTSCRKKNQEMMTSLVVVFVLLGKCCVTLLNETEALFSYLEKEVRLKSKPPRSQNWRTVSLLFPSGSRPVEQDQFFCPQDCFFYCLVYDPQQKTLLADKGEIRVGPRFQADITDLLNEGEEDGRDQAELETKIWEPESPLTDKQIDQFLVIARSVGTFARALDCSSSIRQPSLHMSAAAASRDITLFHAMDTLHRTGYDMSRAITALVPQGGPVLCRDEMEEWSASEANLFEEALEKYGKDFADIRQDFLPWKSLTSIIEYYYMWKTTDRYVQQKRLKAAEAESRLKQVYIPNYNKPNPNQINVNNAKTGLVNGSSSQAQSGNAGWACESCYSIQCYQWYSWGPPNMQCRLCAICWSYWKKYGGLKLPTRLEGERPGPTRNKDCGYSQAPFSYWVKNANPKYTLKTKQAFYLQTAKLTRLARYLCRALLQPRRSARRPFVAISSAAIKAECTARLPEAEKQIVKLKPATRKPLEVIVKYLELHPYVKPEPVKPAVSLASHPGSASVAKVAPVINHGSTTILGKRSYEQHNGVEGNVKKRLLMPSRVYIFFFLGLPNHSQVRQIIYLLNGKSLERSQRMLKQGSLPPVKGRRMNWIDAPDDVFFMATNDTRKVRKLLASFDIKRAARQPYKQICIKHVQSDLETPLQLRHPVNEEPIVIED
ncbi:MTA1 protein, partial [Atractosteus spatula]|nr:MTA1 protein [Atractosteus spatula]